MWYAEPTSPNPCALRRTPSRHRLQLIDGIGEKHSYTCPKIVGDVNTDWTRLIQRGLENSTRFGAMNFAPLDKLYFPSASLDGLAEKALMRCVQST